MAQTIKLKRSATQGATPTTSQLALGEVAINTYDGKMYIKKDVGGTESIVEIGTGSGGSGLASSFTLYEYTATASQTTFSGSDDNSNSLEYDTDTPPKVLVYLNGVLLDFTTDYTATSGTSVVLTTGAAAGDLVQVAAYKSTVSTTLDIDLTDNQKLLLGTDDDLEIFHDGSNSIIAESGAGSLILRGTNTSIQDSSSVNMIQALSGGAVTLYHNSAPKLATTSTGIDVTGTASTDGLTVAGTAYIQSATTPQLEIAYNSQNITGFYRSGGDFQIKNDNGAGTPETSIVLAEDGAVSLYHDASAKLATTSTGIDVTGTATVDALTSSGTIKAETTFGGFLILKRNDTTLTNNADIGSINFEQTDSDDAGVPVNILASGDGTAGGGKLRFYTGTPTSRAQRQTIYSNGDIEFYEDTGTTAKFHWDASAESLGIGTSSPTFATGTGLQVTSGSFASVRVNHSGSTGLDVSQAGGGAGYLYLRDNADLIFGTNNTERMRLDASGNVGIGTVSPAAPLHIQFSNNDGGVGGHLIKNTNTGTTSNFASLSTQAVNGTIQGTFGSAHYSNWGNAIVFAGSQTNHPFKILTNNAVRATFDTSGNVGIGTTTPDEFSIGSTYKYLAVGGDKPGIINLVGSGTSGSYLQFGTAAGVRRASIHTDSGSSDLAFTLNSSNSGTSLTERFRIKASSGNVGIGTTSPSQKLSVNGNIYSIGGFVNASGYQLNGTYIVDSSRNLVNIGTISSGNITTSGYLAGPATFTIDPAAVGDNTGTVVIAGNLQVDGTTTTINSTTLTVDDKNITLASGSANAAAANGAGITVDCGSGTDATFAYDGTNDEWDLNKRTKITSSTTSALLELSGSATGVFQTIDNTNSSGLYSYLRLQASGRAEGSGYIIKNSGTGNGLSLGSLYLWNDGGTNDIIEFVPNATIANRTSIMENGNLIIRGDVGISATSPTDKLDVAGAVRLTSNISFDANKSGRIYKASNHGLAFHGVTGTENDFALFTPAGQLMVVNPTGTNNVSLIPTAAGNVGIGTTAPSLKFDLSSSNSFGLPGTSGTTPVGFARIGYNDRTWSGNEILVGIINAGANDYAGYIQSKVPTDYSQNRPFLINPQGGNVGIGTTTPNAKLQIEEAGIDTTTTSTSATTQVAIDTFAAATFRSARYTIQVTNSTDSTYHITEILLIHDGTTPQITEYGTIFTGSAEATFDADISSGNVRLLATPATTDSMTFKVVRHCITV